MKKAHIVFKTHLDIGFTDYAHVVEKMYLERFVPNAIAMSEQVASETGINFVWTTGSWLFHRCLETYKGKLLRRLEDAISSGSLAWHALPFTPHTELFTPSLFEFALSLSRELDTRFGKRTRAAKLTDVPGHTRAMIPLLVASGVDFLHIGSNPGSTPPDVPELFKWRNPSDGSSITVMYQKGGYGKIFSRNELNSVISVVFTEDNFGPPSIAEVREAFSKVKEQFPGAKVSASTFDAFAKDLFREKPDMPVIEQEIGDTWIHGAGSAPGKIRRWRELCRLRDDWLESEVPAKYSKQFRAFTRVLLLTAEHTCGMDIKTHLADEKHFTPKQLASALKLPNFVKVKRSWEEQEEYHQRALECLKGTPYLKEAQSRLVHCEPRKIDTSTFTRAGRDLSYSNKYFDVKFNPDSGNVISLVDVASGREWSGARNPIGRFSYQHFGSHDIDRFLRQYGFVKKNHPDWFPRDFGKPGLDKVTRNGGGWEMRLKKVFKRETAAGCDFLMTLAPPEDIKETIGCPKYVDLFWHFPTDSPIVALTIAWRNKPASRIPEAMWMKFAPKTTDAKLWRMEKMGEFISPLDVIKDGNRHLHAVGGGVRWTDGEYSVTIHTMDSPLAAPGAPSLYDFNNKQPDMRQGFSFNLFNNVWGTNFPQWTDEDLLSRFVISFY